MISISGRVLKGSLQAVFLACFVATSAMASETVSVRERILRGEEVFDYVALNEFFTPEVGQILFKIRNTSTIVKRSLVSDVTVDNEDGQKKAPVAPIDVSILSSLNGRPTLFACVQSCSSSKEARYAAFQRRGDSRYRVLSNIYALQGALMKPSGPISGEYDGLYVLVEIDADQQATAYDSYVLSDIKAERGREFVATVVQTRFDATGLESFRKTHEVASGAWLNVGLRARLRFMVQGDLPLFLLTGVSNANY